MDLRIRNVLASGPGSESLTVKAAPPGPVNRMRPRVRGATPSLPITRVSKTCWPGRVIISANGVLSAGLGTATPWQVSAPPSMRRARVFAPARAVHGPSSRLSTTSEGSLVQ